MQTPELPDGSSWVQWVLGIWIAITTGVFMHIYSAFASRPDMERLRQSLEQLREDMAADRRAATADRIAIAERMVTRIELEKQIDRVLAEMNNFRIPDRRAP